VVNDVFVSGVHGSVGLPVQSQWSHSIRYARVSDYRSHAFGQCFLFLKSFSAKCRYNVIDDRQTDGHNLVP